jgi:hypothetical protein
MNQIRTKAWLATKNNHPTRAFKAEIAKTAKKKSKKLIAKHLL